MKKIDSLLLVAVMLLGLVACGAAKPAETQAPETTAAPAPAETAAPAAEAPTEAALVVDTCILKEADDKMLNTYTAIAVNPEAPFTDADGNAVSDVAVNTAGADALIQWLLSQEALDMAQFSSIIICHPSMAYYNATVRKKKDEILLKFSPWYAIIER